MAVRLIPNQLVKLYDTETFNQRNKRLTLDYRQYCQIVREEQTTMFQVQLLPNSTNLIGNGDFQNNINSWTVINDTWRWASGQLQGEKTDTGNAHIRRQFSTTSGKTYRVTGTVQFVNLTCELTVIVRNAGSTTLNAIRYDAVDYGTQPFQFEVFRYADTALASVEFLLDGNMRDLVNIDDVEAYELTEPTVTLERCSGELVKTIPVFDRTDDYLTYAVDWYGLSEDCYRICIEGIDDTEHNYLDLALALGTEGGNPIELEQGGFLKWFG